MLVDIVQQLIPNPAIAAASAAIGAAASATVLAAYSAQRTLTRPIAFALDEETTALAGVLCDMRRYPYLSTITADDFSVASHHHLWTALRDVLGDYATLPEDADEAEAAAVAAELGARHNEILSNLTVRLRDTDSPDVDLERLRDLITEGRSRGYHLGEGAEGTAAADANIITAAEAVLAAGNDRNRMSGIGLIIPGTDPNSLDENHPPLVRSYTPPTTKRRAITGLLGGVVAGLIPGMAAMTGFTGVAFGLAVAAFIILAVTSLVISLVDIDTLYIDTPVWAVGTAAGWAATVGAAVAYGDVGRIWVGLAMVAAVAVLFEGTNLLFKLVRGMDGQGFGDTLIIMATVGIPPALTGDWRLGYWSMMAGLIVGALGWAVARLAGKVTRHTPFAFGPWLAAGWVIAMIFFAYDSLVLNVLT